MTFEEVARGKEVTKSRLQSDDGMASLSKLHKNSNTKTVISENSLGPKHANPKKMLQKKNKNKNKYSRSDRTVPAPNFQCLIKKKSTQEKVVKQIITSLHVLI